MIGEIRGAPAPRRACAAGPPSTGRALVDLLVARVGARRRPARDRRARPEPGDRPRRAAPPSPTRADRAGLSVRAPARRRLVHRAAARAAARLPGRCSSRCPLARVRLRAACSPPTSRWRTTRACGRCPSTAACSGSRSRSARSPRVCCILLGYLAAYFLATVRPAHAPGAAPLRDRPVLPERARAELRLDGAAAEDRPREPGPRSRLGLVARAARPHVQRDRRARSPW